MPETIKDCPVEYAMKIIGGKWKIGKSLGQGSFAVVKQATDVNDPTRVVAVKVFEDVEDEIDLQVIEQQL